MAEKIQLEVEIKGGESVEKASGKIENLRTKLKQLKAQLASGALSEDEFKRISEQAGELDDKLKDVNARVKNLGSDTRKLDGFVTAAQGIAGGFAAAQGAIALFGSENEDLQKTLVKVQGAVALLSGVQAVANVLQKESAAMLLISNTRTKAQAIAQRFLTATTMESVAATYALRAALIASGIGAIVVLLGAAAGAMGLFTKSTEDNKTATDKLKKSHDDLKQSLTEEGNEMARISKLQMENSKQRGDALSTQIKIEQEALQSQLELGRAEIRRILMSRDAYKEGSDDYKKYEDERLAQAQKNLDILNEIELSKVRYKGALDKEEADRQKKISDEQLAQSQKNKEAQKRALEEADRLRKEYDKKRLDLGAETFRAFQDLSRTEEEKELQKIKDNYAEKFNLALGDIETTKQLEALRQSELNAVTQKYKDERDKADKEKKDQELASQKEYNDTLISEEKRLQDAKRGALDAGFNIAQEFTQKNKQLSNVLFAIQKGVAIAQVIVDTQKEIAGYYSNPTWSAMPDGGLAIKTAAATGAKIRAATSIATIGATAIGRLTGQGGGSSTGGGIGGGMGNNPNIQSFQTSNQPNQQGGQSGNMRVYVTETDIRNATRKVNGIYSQATVE